MKVKKKDIKSKKKMVAKPKMRIVKFTREDGTVVKFKVLKKK